MSDLKGIDTHEIDNVPNLFRRVVEVYLRENKKKTFFKVRVRIRR